MFLVYFYLLKFILNIYFHLQINKRLQKKTFPPEKAALICSQKLVKIGQDRILYLQKYHSFRNKWGPKNIRFLLIYDEISFYRKHFHSSRDLRP